MSVFFSITSGSPSFLAISCLLAALFACSLTASTQDENRVDQESSGDHASGAEETVALILFEKGEEKFLGTAYHWLARSNIELEIGLPPNPKHSLQLWWGSKDDERQAIVEINGIEQTIRDGGFTGFRWVTIPLPKNISGDEYTIEIRQPHGNAAFIAGFRVLEANEQGQRSVESTPKLISYRLTKATKPHAFPQMKVVWEYAHPPRAVLADPRMERLFREAESNGRLAHEQLFRCQKFVEGWLNHADPRTGLIPRNLGRDRQLWNPQDSAADNYPFMVLTAALTDPELFRGRMLEILATETKLTSRLDRLPDAWSFEKQRFVSENVDLEAITFGSSEYVKDGLLPLTEWLGPSPWRDRMLGIVDDIWKHASIETPFGKIPSNNVEVNGEMLQALSRIYWMTGDEKYLRWAIRLGDYYLLGDHHPTKDFERLRLLDHGCEIASGLSELYVAVHFAMPKKKLEYGEPIHAMFDRILEVGRDEHGMLYRSIEPRSGAYEKGICDTWGYNYNGVYSLFLIDGTVAYRDAVREVLGNLEEHLTTHHWGSADEYADSIEGAINLYNREPVPSAARWIDSEIKDMWSVQRPDGIVEGWHGDGNSARTAIMYALWKTQGLTIQPWRSDVRLGAVRDKNRLLVSLVADQPYTGKIVFDKPRHQVNMHLPIDYPRINQFPEWFVATSDDLFSVCDLNHCEVRVYSGRKLQDGLTVQLAPRIETRLIITIDN